MPARGLPQVRPCRWHTALSGTWQRQALPEGGLYQAHVARAAGSVFCMLCLQDAQLSDAQ
jgi:hypothetical protein